MKFPSRPCQQTPLFEGSQLVQKSSKTLKGQILESNITQKTRLSKNFILRDFMFSTEASLMGLANLPEDPDMVIRSGKALCEKILEPTLEHFGRFAITFGYQCRQAIEAGTPESARQENHRSSAPHQWDRKTWGNEVYARVDILPFCVEDGLVTKHEFGKWMMMNLDVDLLMQWLRSNVFCVTIGPKPRRVWLEWTAQGKGDNGSNKIEFMGRDYWQRIYPTLAENERPRFAPSCTGGSMRWRDRT